MGIVVEWNVGFRLYSCYMAFLKNSHNLCRENITRAIAVCCSWLLYNHKIQPKCSFRSLKYLKTVSTNPFVCLLLIDCWRSIVFFDDTRLEAQRQGDLDLSSPFKKLLKAMKEQKMRK